jgi:hypothetical protein
MQVIKAVYKETQIFPKWSWKMQKTCYYIMLDITQFTW